MTANKYKRWQQPDRKARVAEGWTVVPNMSARHLRAWSPTSSERMAGQDRDWALRRRQTSDRTAGQDRDRALRRRQTSERTAGQDRDGALRRRQTSDQSWEWESRREYQCRSWPFFSAQDFTSYPFSPINQSVAVLFYVCWHGGDVRPKYNNKNIYFYAIYKPTHRTMNNQFNIFFVFSPFSKSNTRFYSHMITRSKPNTCSQSSILRTSDTKIWVNI